MARHERSQPRPSLEGFKKTSPGDIFWDLLTFDRLMTGPVIHLIYWAGLALIVLGGFGTVGGAVGVAMREEGWMKFFLAIPMVVAGFLVLVAGALLWRSFCEFYVAVFRISDDLRHIRAAVDQGRSPFGGAAPFVSAAAEAPASIEGEPAPSRRRAGKSDIS
jgi:hypothetical protein